jgi:hypothetical protein
MRKISKILTKIYITRLKKDCGCMVCELSGGYKISRSPLLSQSYLALTAINFLNYKIIGGPKKI